MKTFKQYLAEASVNHFINRMQRGLPILVITASRSDVDANDNKKNNEQLRNSIRKAGFGYNRVVGKYTEVVTDENGESKSVNSVDDTCIVYGSKEQEKVLFNFGMMYGKKYNQDSILFIGETITNNKPVLFSTRDDGSLGKIGARHNLGSFHFNKVSDVMTVIRGKSYYFDWDEEKPAEKSNSMTEALLRKEFLKYLENNDSLNNWNYPD